MISTKHFWLMIPRSFLSSKLCPKRWSQIKYRLITDIWYTVCIRPVTWSFHSVSTRLHGHRTFCTQHTCPKALQLQCLVAPKISCAQTRFERRCGYVTLHDDIKFVNLGAWASVMRLSVFDTRWFRLEYALSFLSCALNRYLINSRMSLKNCPGKCLRFCRSGDCILTESYLTNAYGIN